MRQTLMERIEAVKATGLADEIVIEEYEGQRLMTFGVLVWIYLQ